ncbi:MAG: hypothetical protein BroJett040_05660 [Oligoflexia bacterium]|nr:MAG: hypothetical protein BroJett040_05660 [Oligoflexia bacterium]
MKTINFLSILLFLAVPNISHAQSSCPQSSKSIHLQAGDIQSACQAATTKCSSSDNQKSLTPIPLENPSPTSSLIWKKSGEVFDTFYDVPAYSNTPGGKFQCTELVHRFMNKVYGIPTKIGIGLGHAEVLSKNMTDRFKKQVIQSPYLQNKPARLAYIENKCSSSAPVVGSMISLQYTKWGHVGIVRDVKVIDENQIQITLFEQHGVASYQPGQKKPSTQIVLKKDSSGRWSGPNVIGWINVVANQ